MALYGYARVSSTSQETTIQEKALKEAGCSVVRTEKVSGRSRDERDELQTILDFMSEGDTLVVYKLDRLGRNTRDVLNIVHELDQRACFLKVLDRDIDTSRPDGKLILTVLSMVAEMEVGFIRDRQRAGIEAAKARGAYKGRPPSIDAERVKQLKSEGMGPTAIAKELGVTRSAIYKSLAREAA